MVSEVDICNEALASIGTQSTISSIAPSDGSNEANQCAILYYPTRDALLRAAHWDFARRQDALTQLKSSSDTNSTCPIPWQYEYAYPSTCLKARFILPYLPASTGLTVPLTTAQSVAPAGPMGFRRPVRFFVATDSDANGNDSTVILTNQPQATLVFTKQIINPNLFDAQFREALVAALAAKLVPALQLNLALMKGKVQEAEAMINAARVTNGNEGPQVIDNTPDWIRARGLGYGTFECGFDYLNWDNMAWPAEF